MTHQSVVGCCYGVLHREIALSMALALEKYVVDPFVEGSCLNLFPGVCLIEDHAESFLHVLLKDSELDYCGI